VSEPVTHSFFVSATPRSGSSLLADALEFTRIAGRPREYFEPTYEQDWFARLGITAEIEYLQKFKAAGTTPNGVFGAKLHWHQFLHLKARLRRLNGNGTPDDELLRRAFPDLKFIFLTRRDKVQQAVSYYKALETDFWRSVQPVLTGRRGTTTPALSFNFEQIDRWVRRFTEDEANWCQYFETTGLEPFEVVYEDFSGTYESTILAILRFLSIPIPEGMQIQPPRLHKLADEVSEDWARRYRAQKWPPRPARQIARRSYMISTAPRTGGFLLAEALESTQIAGRPREYFDPPFQQEWCSQQGITSDMEYYDKAMAAGTTPNGVFGAKVLWHQFEHLMVRLRLIGGSALSDLELLRRTFPDLRYVFLTRKDKIRQAVSYDRAIRSGIWWSIPNHSDCEAEAAAPGSVIMPPFDFEQIDGWVTRLTEFDAKWRRHFKRMGLEPFEVVYEDLAVHYESTVRTILGYLNLPDCATVSITPPRLQKQADDVTEEWVRRYHELKADLHPARILT
jgi:LPS sulfotransferase NodH